MSAAIDVLRQLENEIEKLQERVDELEAEVSDARDELDTARGAIRDLEHDGDPSEKVHEYLRSKGFVSAENDVPFGSVLTAHKNEIERIFR
jgi:cell division protein FtsB